MANVRGNKIEKIVPSAGWTEDSNTHYLLVDLPGFKKENVQLEVLISGHIKVSGAKETKQKKTVGFEQTYKIPDAENSDLNNVRAKFDGEILYVTIPKKPEHLEEEVKKRDKDDVVNGHEENNNTQLQQIPDDQVVKHDEEENNTQLQQKPDDQVVKNDQEENNTQLQQLPDDQVVKHDEEENNTQLQQKPANNNHDEVKNKELGGDDHQINSSKIKEEKLLKEGNEIKRFSEEDVKKWEDGGDCLTNTIKMLSENRGIILTAVIAFSLGLLLSRRFQVGH